MVQTLDLGNFQVIRIEIMNFELKKEYDNYKSIMKSNYEASIEYKEAMFKGDFGGKMFIINSILSIFDSDKDNKLTAFFVKRNDSKYNGQIEEDEFNSISIEEYNEKIKDIEQFYKDTHNGKELKYHIPTYDELKQMIVNDNDSKKITVNELLEPIAPNSTIGQINQHSYGECYQDAADLALSLTDSGQALLSRSIKETDKGYEVTLYGAKDKKGNVSPKKYFISHLTLKHAQEQNVNEETYMQAGAYKKYTSGDANVVLFDLAIAQYRKDTGYVPPKKHSSTKGGENDYLSAGHAGEVLTLITGKKFFIITPRSTNVASESSVNTASKKVNKMANKDTSMIKKNLNIISKNQKSYAVTTTFVDVDGKIKDYDLFEAHAYAIKNIDIKNNKIYLIDSHNGNGKKDGKIHPVPLDIYYKYVAAVQGIKTT